MGHLSTPIIHQKGCPSLLNRHTRESPARSKCSRSPLAGWKSPLLADFLRMKVKSILPADQPPHVGLLSI